MHSNFASAVPTHRTARALVALTAVALAVALFGPLPETGAAVPGAEMAQEHRVGHAVKRMTVPGSAIGEERKAEVHLWYPADVQSFSEKSRSVYTSALNGKSPCPAAVDSCPWDPLSWTFDGEMAREGVQIDQGGKPFPVIVFSHGSVNDPIDYAHTLERIAGQGFVVAAPSHVNNTQEDVRIDFINREAGRRLFNCNDGRLPPCARPNVPLSMADRVKDVTYTLDRLPAWLEDRADVDRAGVLGHSRGTVTALAAAGGSGEWGPSVRDVGPAKGLNCVDPKPSGDHSPCWPGLEPEPRVKAVMGLAIGARPVTFGANVANVRVPSLLVAGTLDFTSPQAVSEEAYQKVSSDDKAFVSIKDATHRSFDSTYCDQAQAAGAKAQGNPRAILDLHTVRGIVAPGTTGQGTSGRATQYCPYATFTEPTDIRGLIASLTGIKVTPDNVPETGLETDEVKEGVTELAATFFGTVLKRTGNDGPHFTRYLAPKWLEKHEEMVDSATVDARGDAICPYGQCDAYEESPEAGQ